MSGKKKDPVKVRAGKMGGRPPFDEEQRRSERAELLLRPGDMAKLRAAAQRRNMPTGRLVNEVVRDIVLLFLEEPGATARAVMASIRMDLGLDQVEAETSREPAG